MRLSLNSNFYFTLSVSLVFFVIFIFTLVIASNYLSTPETISAKEKVLPSLILPFKSNITEKDSISLLASDKSHFALQEATHFLSTTNSKYPILSLPETQTILMRLNFDKNDHLGSKQALDICKRSLTSHLIAGTITTSQREDAFFLQILSFDCNTKKIIQSRKVKIKERIELQAALRQTLRESSPFLHLVSAISDNYRIKPSNLDIIALLDYSGSMYEDLMSILSNLYYLREHSNYRSRFGAITMQTNRKVDFLSPKNDWSSNLAILREKSKKDIKGEVSFASLNDGLNKLASYEQWLNKPAILFFTDLFLSSKDIARLSLSLGLLKQRGFNFCFFPLARQERTSKFNLLRLARNLKASYMHDLIYGRLAILAKEGALFFLSRDKHFYLTKQNIEAKIHNSATEWPALLEKLEIIETSYYSKKYLNLSRLPQAYAKRKNDQVLKLGPSISNIGLSISDCLSGIRNKFAKNDILRVLVKNMGHAFWINIRKSILTTLKKYQNKSIYLGLHWENRDWPARFINLDSHFYVSKSLEVPRAFVWDWKTLQAQANNKINKKDIWFLKLKIIKWHLKRS